MGQSNFINNKANKGNRAELPRIILVHSNKKCQKLRPIRLMLSRFLNRLNQIFQRKVQVSTKNRAFNLS